jgi:signal-transduction protein with cAMP-binding, CBS, and nucleotidyltransferase domain
MALEEDEIDRISDEEHPGGDLESSLDDPLAPLCKTPIILEPDASIADALRRMRAEGRGCVLIVNKGQLRGIFTERDILLKIAGNTIDLEKTPISAYMTADPDTLPADASVAFALHKMVVEGFRHIPLLDEVAGPTVGSMRDLMEYLCEFLNRDVLNIPPRPRQGFRSREGG